MWCSLYRYCSSIDSRVGGGGGGGNGGLMFARGCEEEENTRRPEEEIIILSDSRIYCSRRLLVVFIYIYSPEVCVL